MESKSNEWAKNEFGNAVLGDKRLTDRLVDIADSLANMPESSINQACESWSEAKAAYRFFQNESIKEADILASHITKTVERAKDYKRIIVIQDTSFLSYTGHKKNKRVGGYF
ncbi:WO-orf5-like-protein [Wolbachia endosymbiont of Armadillidium vulgare str. wVulC]|nr:WO-orf5-like-protein [Wolbachia endosymbiont of Armadillidium vulgare str. wVulC]